jgi:predicted transposase/invertase (TIGR01784 family)
MKRDTIFYQIFQQFPSLLFDLLPVAPSNPSGYTFDSIEVKETSFRIDGVLIPPDPGGIVFFVEIQMQEDKSLYERIFCEIGIYTYRHRERFADWQAVVIYPSRNIEQSRILMPPELFASGRISRVYLDELGAIAQLPAGLGLMVLTTLEGEEAISQARAMLARSRSSEEENAIIDMVSTIMVYKFKTLSRDEVDAMLGFDLKELKQTRVYQEAREDERRDLVLMLLNHKFGNLSPQNQASVETLNFARLQALGTALLDFTNLADLEDWLNQ